MRFLFALFLICAPMLALAQDNTEESGGYIADLLQDSLSGENRSVQIIGLSGALSSRAQIEKITVSDDQGIWLTITNAELDWNRLALLSKRLEINTLKADEIVIERQPKTAEPEFSLPTPEATVFQVPELPVSIDIGQVSVPRLKLAKPVFGLAAELSISAKIKLSDGELSAEVSAKRLDKPIDQLNLIADFANETRILTMDLAVNEVSGGLISEMLNLPGRPSVRLMAKGTGPLSDFTADIALATNNQNRLNGQVSLRGVRDGTSGAIVGTDFDTDLAGDLAALVAQDFRAFFGVRSRLKISGTASADGAVSISQFDLTTGSATLTGNALVDRGGVINGLSVIGEIKSPGAQSVILPVPGATTKIDSARFEAAFDKSKDNTWSATGAASGLNTSTLNVGEFRFSGRGQLNQGGIVPFSGSTAIRLNELVFTDPSLQTAIGDNVSADGNFSLLQDGSLVLQDLELAGTDYSAAADGQIAGLESGFQLAGDARIGTSDLSRFSGLAGRPLSGALVATISGEGSPLGGAFNIELDARAENSAIGTKPIDDLIKGTTTLRLDMSRGLDGTEIRWFEVVGSALSSRASGTLTTDQSDINFFAKLDDASRLLSSVQGPVTITGNVQQSGSNVLGIVRARGPNSSYFNLTGEASQQGEASIKYDAQLNKIERILPRLSGSISSTGTASRTPTAQWTANADTNGSAGVTGRLNAAFDENTGAANMRFNMVLDRLERLLPGLNGSISARGRAARDELQAWKLNASTTGSAGLSGTFKAVFSEQNSDAEVYFDGAIERVERILPEISGVIQAAGLATRTDTTWDIDTTAKGPGGLTADIDGSYDQANNRADISAKGQVQLGLANPIVSPNTLAGGVEFDLNLHGEPALDTLSGTITTRRAKIAIPSITQTLTNIDATARISDGQAEIAASGGPRSGGTITVDGSVELEAPFNANLRANLSRVVVTDNISVVSSADGQLALSGPLASGATISGQVDFGETEINIATASGSVSAAPIPDITHVGETAGSRRTRIYAGLIATKGAAKGPVYNLNVELNAPDRVYARGRGLNAELGGRVLIRGTSAQVVPSGEISLIRGTFDLLGRRLTLDEGQISLQGQLEPYLSLFASTPTAEGEATLSITGPASSPTIEVTSVPERPSEEALAMLIFGDQFSNLSPLRIAQLSAQLRELGGQDSFFSKLRRKLGLDALDVGTTENGSAQVGAGAHLSDTVYTDVTVNAEGESEINLNLDVTDNVTLKGSVDNTGNTGVGLFYQRDY